MQAAENLPSVDVAAWLCSFAPAPSRPRQDPPALPLRQRPILRDVNGALGPDGDIDPDRVRSALFAISADTDDYELWRNLGWAVRDALGDDGLELFQEWCLTAPHRYKAGSAEQLFRSDKGNGITVATLIKLARDAGWRDPRTAAPCADPPAERTEHTTSPSPADKSAALLNSLLEHRVSWSISEQRPSAHDFLIGCGAEGLFPMGKLGVLAAPGGTFKSALAIVYALHVAAGKPWAGLPVPPGAVLFIALEDDAAECQRRATATALTQFDESERAVLEQRVAFIALPGVDARLTARDFGGVRRTGVPEKIIEAALAQAEACGLPIRLIVIDHARLAIGGDANDSEAVTELTRALSHVGAQTGAAVLLLCHSPKSSLNSARSSDFNAADVLGSGAFVDNARFAAVLFGLTLDERKKFDIDADSARNYVGLRIIKSNYSRADRNIYLRKTPVEGWGVAIPVPVELGVTEAVPRRANQQLADRILALVASRPGRISKRQLREQYSGRDGPLQASDHLIRLATEQLLSTGRLHARPPSAAEAAELPRQVREVLAVAPPSAASGG